MPRSQDEESLTAVAPKDAPVTFPARCVACLDSRVTPRALRAAHELNFSLGDRTLCVTLEQELAGVPYCAIHGAQLDARTSTPKGRLPAATYLPGAHSRGTGTLGFAVMVDAELGGEGNDRTVVVNAITFAFENATYAALFRAQNGFGTAEDRAAQPAEREDEDEGERDVAS